MSPGGEVHAFEIRLNTLGIIHRRERGRSLDTARGSCAAVDALVNAAERTAVRGNNVR